MGQRLGNRLVAGPEAKDETARADLTLGRCEAAPRRSCCCENKKCEAESQSSNGWTPDSALRAASAQRLAQKSPCDAAAPFFQADTASALRPAR